MRAATDQEFNARARANERSYVARHPEKIRVKNAKGRIKFALSIRNSHLRKLYGVTQADYERLLAEQGGCCAICGSASPGGHGNKYFSVDHDHVTRKVRQLLCAFCNSGLGYFKDSLDRLRKAVSYLEKHTQGNC